MLYRSFNLDKTLQALAFLIKNEQENYMKLIKLLYFAERYHLRHYGDLIIYDNYTALKFGPVQSKTKDIITLNEFYCNNVLEEEPRKRLYSLIEKNSYDVCINDKNSDLLSESEIESLEFSQELFGKFDQFALANISHDYPEWKKFEDIFLKNSATSEQMSVLDFFDNPEQAKSPYISQYLKHDPFGDVDSEQLHYFKNNFRLHNHYIVPI